MGDDAFYAGLESSDEHTHARRTSFGAGAAAYDAVRPAWTAEAAHWLLGSPAQPLRVLDLGAGTGLGTRTIAALGHAVVAVDPSAGMVEALRRSASRLPPEVARRIDVREGPAEVLDEPDASRDAVTAFQAWHWFDGDRATAACARVIRPGGWLGLAWNAWSPEQGWVRELADIVGSPEMLWQPGRGISDASPRLAGFDCPEHALFTLRHDLTVDELAMLASTWSQVAVRSDRDVLSDVLELASRAADEDGRLTFPYVSSCFRFQRHGMGA